MVRRVQRRRMHGVTASARGLLIAVVIGGGLLQLPASASQRPVHVLSPNAFRLSPSPNLPVPINGLNGIACAESADCFAVGYASSSPELNTEQALIERWNDRTWEIVATIPSPGPAARLNGVSCSSEVFCVAVGQYRSSEESSRSLILVWNGDRSSARWKRMLRLPALGEDDELASVSCTSSVFCVAVGTASFGHNVRRTFMLMMRSDHEWTRIDSWSTGMTSELFGVSCVRSTFCEAVGTYYVGKESRSLIEAMHANLHWAPTASPSPNDVNYLNAVSCISSSFCKAVGMQAPLEGSQSLLILSYDGQWTMDVAAHATKIPYEFTGVSCASTMSCVAVGQRNDAPSYADRTVAESFNGLWSIKASSNRGTIGSTMSAISCPTTRFCLAVGDFGTTSPVGTHTLVEAGP